MKTEVNFKMILSTHYTLNYAVFDIVEFRITVTKNNEIPVSLSTLISVTHYLSINFIINSWFFCIYHMKIQCTTWKLTECDQKVSGLALLTYNQLIGKQYNDISCLPDRKSTVNDFKLPADLVCLRLQIIVRSIVIAMT